MQGPRRNRGWIAGKIREMDRLVAEGMPLDRAFESAGVSEADYLVWRAELAGIHVDHLAELHRAHREAERGVDPKDYVGRIVPGICPVCGTDAGFENYTELLRETGHCRTCGANERQRQMAFMIRHRLRLGFEGALKLPPGMTTHNTESSGALHRQLMASGGYTFSEYWGPEHTPGETVRGVRHEDLQALSFADDSLDLILSSDVLEHMPFPYEAHAEIFRVLRPGGVHIFTVPFNGQRHDDVRARIEDGEIRYFGEKLYHGDPVRPDEGVLVWTVFGSEMLDRLADIGFEPLTWWFSSVDRGIVSGALVFEARKPPNASPLWLERLQRIGSEAYSMKVELQAQREAVAERDQRIRALETSISWRLTAPLRTIRSWF